MHDLSGNGCGREWDYSAYLNLQLVYTSRKTYWTFLQLASFQEWLWPKAGLLSTPESLTGLYIKKDALEFPTVGQLLATNGTCLAEMVERYMGRIRADRLGTIRLGCHCPFIWSASFSSCRLQH